MIVSVSTVKLEQSHLHVLLVDDHPLTLLGTEHFIKQAKIPGFIEVLVSTASSQQEALRQVEKRVFDMTILDLQLPDGHGYELARKLLDRQPDCRILFFTGVTQHFSPTELSQLGVRGYVNKAMASHHLIEAMLTVHYGGVYLQNHAMQAPLPEHAAEVLAERLSLRESQVLKQLALDRSKHEIAHQLGISVRTVETYRTRLMQKINCRSLVGLVRYAVEQGLVD